MTKDEALKLALEALIGARAFLESDAPVEIWGVNDKAITAIKEALAQPEQEPVSVKRMVEWVDCLKSKSDYGQHMKIPSEMSSGACWELAIELEQFINTTPPQRKPLTGEQIEFTWMKSMQSTPGTALPIHEFAKAIEAAHGIKENT
jgi:hypothetical protein